jgi:DNA-binding Lrp family transcriptional regulator
MMPMPAFSGMGVAFFRVPEGMPTTAFWRIYGFLHTKARFNPEIRITDRELATKFGVTREYANECLRKLEELGIIVRNRIGEHGRRLIKWILPFARPKSATKSGVASKPADPASPAAAGKPSEQNRNRTGREMARLIIDELKAKGWSLELNKEEKIEFRKLRADAEVRDGDLRLFRMHLEDIRDLLREIKARE